MHNTTTTISFSFHFTRPSSGNPNSPTNTNLWHFQLSCTTNLHVCRSILYKFFSGTSFLYATEHSSIPAQKLRYTWHELRNVIGRRVVVVQETVMNLRQTFRASFWYQFLECVSPTYQPEHCYCQWTKRHITITHNSFTMIRANSWTD